MNKLTTLVLLLISIVASAQTITIDLSDYYTKKQVDSLLKISSPPPVGMKPCDRGPKITKLSDLTSTSMTLRFDGKKVTELSTYIYDLDSTKQFSKQSFKPETNTLSLKYDKLAVGKYRLYVKGDNCSGIDDQIFEISDTSPPVKPKCSEGPIAKSMMQVTSTSGVLNFHGLGVTHIRYSIYRSGNEISAGVVEPQSANVQIPFGSAQADGAYQITIMGENCVSPTSTIDFNIKTETGGGGGGTSPPPGPTGKAIPKRIFSGKPENMDIQVIPSTDGGWLINDLSSVKPDNEHIFWYGINNHIIKTREPLKDYPWPANTPLEVWKAQPRNDTYTLEQWSETRGYFKPDAAQEFSDGDSYPQAIFYFQPADSAVNANKQFPHWMDFAPDITLPKGKVWVMPIGDIDSYDLIRRKGVTHISKYQFTKKPFERQVLEEGRGYDEVPKTPEQFSLNRGTGVSNWVPKKTGGRLPIEAAPVDWPSTWNEKYWGVLREGQTEPMTALDGREAADKYQTAMPLVVFENSEGDHAVGAQWPFVGTYYQRYKERMTSEWAQKGIKPLIAHNYYTGFTSFTGNIDNDLALLRKPVDQWPSNPFTNRTLRNTTAVCFPYYLSSPDKTLGEAYKLIFASKIADAAGFETLFFPQEFHEDRPNNYQEVRYDTGKFYLKGKKEYTPAEVITMTALSLEFGTGVVPFGAGAKTLPDYKFRREFHGKEGNLWLPNGATEYQRGPWSFPYYVDSGGEVWPNMNFEYAMAEGVRIFAQYFAPVHSGEAKWLDYRMDGGPWITASNQYADDVINAEYGKRPVVYSKTLNGKTAVFYLWPYADTKLHTLEYRLGGKTYTRTVHSTIIHPYMH